MTVYRTLFTKIPPSHFFTIPSPIFRSRYMTDITFTMTCENKAIQLRAWTSPEGSKRLRLPISRHSAYEGGKVVSPTHRRPLPSGNIPGTHFCYKLSQPQGHSAAWRIVSMKNVNDTIGNRTRDLPTCSSVPQTTMPPRSPIWHATS